MTAKYGAFGEFSPSLEDWGYYNERQQQYFKANDVAEEKQNTILLSGYGVGACCLIKKLAVPDSKSFTELVKLVSDHYSPIPSMIMESFQFNTCIY